MKMKGKHQRKAKLRRSLNIQNHHYLEVWNSFQNQKMQ